MFSRAANGNLTVYSFRRDMLGSALLNLSMGWRFAERVRGRFIAVWSPNAGRRRRNVSLRELFDISKLPFSVMDAEVDESQFLQMPRVDALSKTQLDDLFAGPREICYRHTGVFCVSNETHQQVVEEARSLIRTIQFTQPIHDAFEALSIKRDLSAMVSIHVRRGDIIQELFAREFESGRLQRLAESFVTRFVDEASYTRAIEGLSKERTMLIFSNDVGAGASLLRRLKGLNVALAAEIIDDTGVKLTPTQRDFVEMLVMGSTSIVFGPKSNYSRFAALYGSTHIQHVYTCIHANDAVQEITRLFGGAPQREKVLLEIFNAFARVLQNELPREAEEFAAAAVQYGDSRAIRRTLDKERSARNRFVD